MKTIFTNEMIQEATKGRESRIGNQRAYIANHKEELFKVALDYKSEKGQAMKVAQLRRLISAALVEGGIEKEAYKKTTNSMKNPKGIKVEVTMKDYIASKALVVEIFKGQEALYR